MIQELLGAFALIGITAYALVTGDKPGTTFAFGILLIASAFWLDTYSASGKYQLYVAGAKIEMSAARGRWIRGAIGVLCISLGMWWMR